MKKKVMSVVAAVAIAVGGQSVVAPAAGAQEMPDWQASSQAVGEQLYEGVLLALFIPLTASSFASSFFMPTCSLLDTRGC